MKLILTFQGNAPNHDGKIQQRVTEFVESLPASFAHLEVSCVKETDERESPKVAQPAGKDRPKSKRRSQKA